MADLRRVVVWAHALFDMHLPQGQWTFRFDNAKRRAGLCNHTTRTISVSRHLAARFSDDEIHQILLHEVAHAMAGPRAGHGPVWKNTAREIGYVGGRTHNGEIAHEEARWVGTCPGGHEHYRFKRPTRQASCAKCTPKFSRAHLIEWRQRWNY